MFHKMREKMKTVVIIVVVAMAGGLLWAGGAYLFGGRQTQSTQAAAVVATVNGQAISSYDLHQVFINQLQQLEQEQGIIPSRSYEVVRFQALDTLIRSIILNQEVAKRNLSASKAEVDEELQRIIDLFASEDDYKLQLTLAGITEDYLRAQLGEEIKIDKLIREVSGDHPVSEQEIREAYEQVRASHILIRPDGQSEEAWTSAESQAWDIHAQLTTENFADLAQTMSGDSSASQGGDIGFISRGRTVPEFEEAAFALGIGEISEPVRSMYGYHIITVTQRKDAEGEDFEKARPMIEDRIRSEKGQDDLMAWFDEVRNAADVVYIDYQMNAVERMQAGEFEDAVHYYKLAIEQQPDDGYLYASLGDAYESLGNVDEAIAQYKLALEKYATDHILYMGLGDLYRENERIDEAVEAYLKASELVPNDIFVQLAAYQYVTGMERNEDAMVIEERIAAFQEMQNELLKEQQATTETPESEDTAESEEVSEPGGAEESDSVDEPAESPEN